MKLVIKKYIKLLIDVWNLSFGYFIFKLNKKTPVKAHQSLINLFCYSRGKTNDLLSKIVSWRHPARDIENSSGILGCLSEKKALTINEFLLKEGFYIFDSKLKRSMLDDLQFFASISAAKVRGIPSAKYVYDEKNLKGVRYDFDSDDLINLPAVQALITDHSILKIAQNYLKCPPILDLIGMWWHTAYQDDPDEEAAQFYHFDMDRIKWIKFFIYVSEVTNENGPHFFIPKTHQTNGIPNSLLQKGYARLTDCQVNEALDKLYCPQIFTGEPGTIFAEDTRGLHKGGVVKRESRLILQLQFTNHMFGANYPRLILKKATKELSSMIQKYPRIYSNLIST